MKTFNIVDVLIGSDIELFLKDRTTNEIVSSEGIVKGTKYEPFQFDPENPYFGTSLDNVLTEFTIPPAKSEVDWIASIKKALDYINTSIPSHLCTVAEPAAILDEKWLMTEQAKVFGCEPDFNVYLQAKNPAPCASNPNLRSAGGHIHIGYAGATSDTDEGVEINEAIIKAMDLFIGIPSVIQEPDNQRKLLYGKAGAFRFKDYGVEYRTVSNYFLQSDNLTKWAFNNSRKSIDFLNSGGFEELESVASTVRTAIDSCNKTLASNLIRQFQIEMV